MWDAALKKAGHFNRDAGTQRLQMNLHRLRNFFSVQVAGAVGTQVSELLLGHSDQYGGAYTGRSPEQLEREYMKAEYLLTIGATSSRVESTEREVADLKRQLKEMDARSRAFEFKVAMNLMEYEKQPDGSFTLKKDYHEKLKRFGLDREVSPEEQEYYDSFDDEG
jgi:hypothetical protein